MGTRPDTAAQNIPMSGSRGRSLDRDISRNVKQQKVAERSADRARNSKFKTEQSRAKKLRDAHVGAIAQAKGLPKSQVESALKAQTPSTQIKALKNWVKQNRTTAAKPAAAPVANNAAFRRTGKTVAIARKKGPIPTKEDRAIEKIRGLKSASPAFGRGESAAVFLPDKALTPQRRRALGLSAFSSDASSQRWRVSRQVMGSERGVLIAERSGYRASLPKAKPGVIKLKRKRKP